MEEKVQRVILGQKVLLFRINMNVNKDAVEKHKEVLMKEGFCWFGKIGRIPMLEKIEEVLKEKHPHMLLYTKQKLFLYDIDDSSFTRPKDGFPKYYYQEFFLKGEEPNLYLRIRAINEIPITELAKYYVSTTAKTAEGTFTYS